MSYTIEVRSDAPIIILTEEPDSSVVENTPNSIIEMRRLLSEQPEPVFVIVDLSHVAMELDDHIRTSILSARGPNPIMHHPKIREHLFVGPDPFTRMATRMLNSPTFGRVKVSQFDTLEEALAHCKVRISEADHD